MSCDIIRKVNMEHTNYSQGENEINSKYWHLFTNKRFEQQFYCELDSYPYLKILSIEVWRIKLSWIITSL
jgi:hypothetical protein